MGAVVKWESKGLYEHPAAHLKGVYGIVCLSASDVYYMRIGGGVRSCPQSFGSAIQAKETGVLGRWKIVGEFTPEVLYTAMTKGNMDDWLDFVAPGAGYIGVPVDYIWSSEKREWIDGTDV